MNDKTEPTTLNKLTGCPVAHNKYSLTAGKNGPVVVTDLALLEKLQLFNREKIPARNVHALGVGVYGEFTVTNPEISKYTCAKLFSQPGKKTQLFARFSGIFTEQGDSDTTRDPRGFAIKFYTEEGNWDLLGIDTPVFNVRDAKLGPDAVHSFKRDPRTGMWNPTQSWDFATAHPESFHQLLMIYSDRSGTPISYRKMNAYGCHTFSFINAQKQRYWVKFHIKSLQGAQGFTNAEAKLVAGEDPNFLSRDLIQAVGKGDFPKWKMYVQIMEDAEGYKNPWTFDPTKVWLHKDYPLIEVGEIVINRNVTDYFAETEQVAFSPSTTVPGIGLSPDRLLMGRLLIYDDTQHHRIGTNFKQLPVNRPNGMALPPNTHHVGGEMNLDSRNHYPHYADSIFGGANANKNYLIEPEWKCDGNANYYPPDLEGTDSDYYEQPGLFYRILSDQDKINLSNNLASSLEKVTSDEIIRKAIYHLKKCDANLGSGVETLVYNKKKGSSKTQNEVIVERIANSLING